MAPFGGYKQSGNATIIGKGREVIGLRKDGSNFPMDLSVGEAVINDEHYFTGVIRDITERKEAEQKLTDAFQVISSSIEYASNIQLAALPDDALDTPWTDAEIALAERLRGRDVVSIRQRRVGNQHVAVLLKTQFRPYPIHLLNQKSYYKSFGKWI